MTLSTPHVYCSARSSTLGPALATYTGVLVADTGSAAEDAYMFRHALLREAIYTELLREKNQVLVKVYNRKAIDVGAVVDEYLGYAERLRQ